MSKKNSSINLSSYFYTIIGTIFVIGVITTVLYYNVRIEGLDVKYECPEKLIKTGDSYKLYNGSNIEVNQLSSLDDYVKLINSQYDQNIFCPILSVEEKSDLKPSLLKSSEQDEKISLLIDANRNSNVYNVNLFPGFDPMNQYIGTNTPLDLLHNLEQKNKASANPMDPNWGGNNFTNKVVESGYYKPNTR